MTNDQIEKFVHSEDLQEKVFKIDFKTRHSMLGIFKSKNFWRIVTERNIDSWKKSKDMSLARIFNGMEITRLSLV